MSYEDGNLEYLKGRSVSILRVDDLLAVVEQGEGDEVRNLGRGEILSGSLNEGVTSLEISDVRRKGEGYVLSSQRKGLHPQMAVRPGGSSQPVPDSSPVEIFVPGGYTRNDWIPMYLLSMTA
tara:strand:- start:107 stop:472 length:366 start_codon:yes stop_codon:yes gene_type:complete